MASPRTTQREYINDELPRDTLEELSQPPLAAKGAVKSDQERHPLLAASARFDPYSLASVSALPQDIHTTCFARYARGDWNTSFHISTALPEEIMPSSRPPTNQRREGRYLSNDGRYEYGVLDDRSHAIVAIDINACTDRVSNANVKLGFQPSPLTQPPSENRAVADGDLLAAAPDLTASVENIYRSFISDKQGILPISSNGHNAFFSPSNNPSALNGFTVHDKMHSSTSLSHFDGSMEEEEKKEMDRVGLILNPNGYAALAAKRYRELGYLEAPMPEDEAGRRKALRFFKPFHSKLDPHLDQIARLGKKIFGASRSLISLVDATEVQLSFDSEDPYLVPRGTPICSHAILLKNDQPLVVLDTLEDWRFKGNKAVTTDLQVCFYAGHPLKVPTGENIGVFCVIDDKPRSAFTEDEKKELKELSLMALRGLEGMARKRQMKMWDRMQFTTETFHREAVAGTYTMEQLLVRAVKHISGTLDVEGVLIFDALNVNPSIRTDGLPWSTLSDEQVHIMAASEHASHLTEVINATQRASDLKFLFEEHPNGLIYARGDEILESLAKLLPKSVAAAAAVPVSRGDGEPFAVICIYTLKSEYYFPLLDPTLSFLRSMGLVLCSVQQRTVLSLADKAKVDFIANISHELRTPLHGVVASCDLLSETELSDQQVAFLGTAKLCANSLTETINHVLDFTKSTSDTAAAGKASTTHGRSADSRRVLVDLKELCEESMIESCLGRRVRGREEIGELYAPLTTEEWSNGEGEEQSKRKVEVLIDIDPNVKEWTVMVDKAGLRRVLMNLIGNSLKFTQEGYVKLTLARGLQGSSDTRIPIQIIIEDTGCGISQSFIQQKLFHPFSQERPFAQGIGLGLAIVRSILKSSGVDGTVDVQSTVGEGTRMCLRFSAPLVCGTDGTTDAIAMGSLNKHPPWRLPSFAFVGFREYKGSKLLLGLLKGYLSRCLGELRESTIEEAKVLILDADNLSEEELTVMFSDISRKQQKVLVLASSPINKCILQKIQCLSHRGVMALATFKPIGPGEIRRLLLRMGLSLSYSTLSPPIQESSLSSTSPHGVIRKRSTLRNMRHDELAHKPSSATSGFPVHDPATGGSLTTKRSIFPRALVVEDNLVNRRVLSAYLRKRGCEFVEAGNGEEGVEAFKRYPTGYFDACLMDLQMPVMDGFQAATAIREIEAERKTDSGAQDFSPRLRMYALSGLASPEDKEKARAIGFDGYLVKPVSFKNLDEAFLCLPPSARWRAF